MSTEKPTPAAPARKFGLFTSVGVAAVGLLALGVIYLSRNVPLQIDFTENKFYSLTDGTRDILKNIDTEVKATLFVTEDKELSPGLISRVRDLEALLRQYESKAPKGHFVLRKVNPAPDTEGGEQASLAGVPVDGKDVVVLSVECLDKRENVDFLPLIGSQREEQAEYEVSRAVTNVLKGDTKKKIGVMSALPLMGSQGPMMGPQQRPWIFFQQLKRDYEVKTIELTADTIDDDLDALVVVHPSGITETMQFEIDQFVLKGKPVVLMLDSHSLVGKASQSQMPPQMAMMNQGPVSSNAPKLVEAWGYSYDANNVVFDVLHKTRMAGGRESGVFLNLSGDSLNAKDPVTSGLNDVLFAFSGAFTGKAAAGLNEDILVQSSTQVQMVPGAQAESQEELLQQNFKAAPGETAKILAVRLTGQFKTAFPDGKPKAEEKAQGDGDEGDDEKKDEAKSDEPATLKAMAEGKSGLVVLVADTDFLYDRFSVQMLGNMAMPFNGNLPFGLNLIDQVAGDVRLTQIRSRGPNRRPFTTIQEIEKEANAKIQGRIAELQTQADEANQRLNELQAAKDPQARNFLSPEQQQEIENFRKSQVEAQRNIRELRKQARSDVDSMLASLKLRNILGTPLLVALIGLGVFFFRRISTSAK